jgi:hypothetical protein
VRPDLTVPYTTNGRSTLGVYNGVAPRVYSSSSMTDPTFPGVRSVHNLPYYGAVQGFGTLSNGANPRPPVNVRGR